jgi:hypothetical protein
MMNPDPQTTKDDGGPAFPYAVTRHDREGFPTGYLQTGMSLLDWFAGQAINGIVARGAVLPAGDIAEWAFRIAKAAVDESLRLQDAGKEQPA